MAIGIQAIVHFFVKNAFIFKREKKNEKMKKEGHRHVDLFFGFLARFSVEAAPHCSSWDLRSPLFGFLSIPF